MKLYIPGLGDEIQLIADWTFDLHDEGRNESLMVYMKDYRLELAYGDRNRTIPPVPTTIPAGTVLKIDRIYIRKGSEEFNSVSFFWKGAANLAKVQMKEFRDTEYFGFGKPSISTSRMRQVRTPKQPIRFWAKLDDVNNIEFEQV